MNFVFWISSNLFFSIKVERLSSSTVTWPINLVDVIFCLTLSIGWIPGWTLSWVSTFVLFLQIILLNGNMPEKVINFLIVRNTAVVNCNTFEILRQTPFLACSVVDLSSHWYNVPLHFRNCFSISSQRCILSYQRPLQKLKANFTNLIDVKH